MEKVKVIDKEISKTGKTQYFDGYVQFGTVYTSEHQEFAYTPDYIQSIITNLQKPNYLYSRQKDGYISLYGKEPNSPTGVVLIGGLPNELEFLLKVFGHTSQLSPTEDMRSAH